MSRRVVQLQTAVNILLRIADPPTLASYSCPDDMENVQNHHSEDQGVDGDGDKSLPAAPLRRMWALWTMLYMASPSNLYTRRRDFHRSGPNGNLLATKI